MSDISAQSALKSARGIFPGLLTAVTVALAARFLSEHYGAPVMLMALLLGMAFSFLSEDDSVCLPGIEFASKTLLRFGVALLGLGITVQQIAATGPAVLLVTVSGVAFTIGSGLAIAWLLGRRAAFGMLAGGAVAICGASAALAIASVLPRDSTLERDTVFTVIAVTAMSTLAMILYPIIAAALELSDLATGVFLGATIHDVAQVVGAGYSVSDDVGDTATFVKLLRVALLVPLVVILSMVFARQTETPGGRRLPFPFFVIGFSALVVVGSYGVVPEATKAWLLSFSKWCLTAAIVALGMKTSLKRLGDVGGGAIVMIVALTAGLAALALLLVKMTAL
ncbi:YeiH family protein [Citreimonas salinaria]|uniref:Conserved hypothetical integral membrane protein n=1 Tax=Citreimonas salinaria TaxID=321339 RepID=A0A1H3NHE0_9RHOB|nr:putative sulfate exporter family transporter [Citreimonas salinaria]SDY88100.1 conserved hypothetical integral membrane protein [Citreimonas salinaria]